MREDLRFDNNYSCAQLTGWRATAAHAGMLCVYAVHASVSCVYAVTLPAYLLQRRPALGECLDHRPEDITHAFVTSERHSVLMQEDQPQNMRADRVDDRPRNEPACLCCGDGAHTPPAEAHGVFQTDQKGKNAFSYELSEGCCCAETTICATIRCGGCPFMCWLLFPCKRTATSEFPTASPADPAGMPFVWARRQNMALHAHSRWHSPITSLFCTRARQACIGSRARDGYLLVHLEEEQSDGRQREREREG